jgi:hypothetical protein
MEGRGGGEVQGVADPPPPPKKWKLKKFVIPLFSATGSCDGDTDENDSVRSDVAAAGAVDAIRNP